MNTYMKPIQRKEEPEHGNDNKKYSVANLITLQQNQPRLGQGDITVKQHIYDITFTYCELEHKLLL